MSEVFGWHPQADGGCVMLFFFYNIADVMFTVVRETDLRLHVSKARYDKGQNKHGGGIK